MAYIGKTPTVGNFQVCDAISVVNNQAAYTMQVGSVNVSPESANHMIVSLNGVIQKPTDAFTVSGSTITFASNLVTGDVINFIQILGNVLDLGVPSDATVSTAKIVDGAVTSAKLASGVGGVAGITSSADATAMTITSDEDIGIGETSPLGKLHVKTGDSGASASTIADELVIESSGSGGLNILTGSGGNAQIDFGDSADNNIGRIQYNHSDNSLRTTVNAAERMRITSDGSVGIGTTSPSSSYRLSSVGTVVGALIETTGTNSGFEACIIKRPNSGTLVQFLGSGQVGSITTNGSSTTYSTSSDYRLKENVVEIENATARLKQLQPKRFNFISDADTTVDGFIAHEVSDIVPEAISGEKDAVNEDGSILPQGIDQSKLVPLLVKTIQELEDRITTLENA